MAQQCRGYVGTQFFAGIEPGSIKDGWRNENLEEQTFPDGVFDIVVSLDVMEHVYSPDKVFREIHRTLASGGIYLCTFPVSKHQVKGWERRFELLPDGTRRDIKEPEIHGNPVSSEGSIVTVDWGYDLHQSIAAWAGFDVRVYRFADRTHGILGEYTEVVACKRRSVE
jgi:SAM-dependent methyltransferase